MERTTSSEPFYIFPEIDSLCDPAEYLLMTQILRFRLSGLSDFAIFHCLDMKVPLPSIRKYSKIVDGMISKALTKAREFLKDSEIDRLLSIRRLDFVIEEAWVLYEKETDPTRKRRLLTAIRDDIKARSELMGLLDKKPVKKDDPNSEGLPDVDDHLDPSMIESLYRSINMSEDVK